jgi:hypothetical protein
MTSKHAAERTIALRLARAGRNIDLLVARVRGAGYGVDGRIARRVDALRADEAQVHARLREMREADAAAWAEHGAELGRRLDELEAQTAIAQTRLRAEQATDAAVFQAAVNDQFEAWGAYAEAVQAGAAAADEPLRGRLAAAARALRERLAQARGTLHDLPVAAQDAAPADYVAVHQAFLDLDRLADHFASVRGPIR